MGDQFTVQISSKLINQLAKDGERLKKKTKKPKRKAPKSPQQSQAKVHQKHTSDGFGTEKGTTAGAGWPLQAPLFLPVPPPAPQVTNAELDAIQSVLQESEKVVERLKKQEEDLAKEVTEKAQELRDKEFKLPYQKPMPCSAEKYASFECYKEHAKNPLKCADVVKTYANCASKVRHQ